MKVGTIGSGMIVDWFLNAAKQNKNVEVAAMYTRKKENAQALADAYHIPLIYTDYDVMLQDSAIDTIYIASPNNLHYEYAKKALQAGKHVICEKPFTSTVKEFESLTAIAKEKKRFLFEAIVTLHMPTYLNIKKHIEALGPIKMVQCNFSQYSSKYDKFLAGETPNVFNPAFSGGALSDINIYNLHFVTGLFGRPTQQHYFPNLHKNGIDTSGVAILSYDGFQAVCIGCKDTKSKCIAQIQGEKGYIILESETSKCAKATMIINKEATDLTIEQNDDALYYELQDFQRIMEQQDYEACWKQLEHSQMLMDVYESCRVSGGIHFPADDVKGDLN